jgi:hypothetical protein
MERLSRSWPALICSVLLAVLGIARHSHAAQIEVSTDSERGEVVVRATALIDADVDTVWRVLTDYVRYPHFIPGVRDCRVVRRDGRRVTVEQAGSALLGPLQLPVSVVYEITEVPPVELWSTAEIGTIGALESHYAVISALPPRDALPREEGRTSSTVERAVLEYRGRLTPRSSALRPLEEAVVRQTVTRQFQALADEIERTRRRTRSPALHREDDAAPTRDALRSPTHPIGDARSGGPSSAAPAKRGT